MNVWRIHLKNDIDANHTRNDLIEYCFKESLIGVGWPKVTIRTNNAAELKEDCLANYGQKSGSAGFKALNAMRKMEVNDLIWSNIIFVESLTLGLIAFLQTQISVLIYLIM